MPSLRSMGVLLCAVLSLAVTSLVWTGCDGNTGVTPGRGTGGGSGTNAATYLVVADSGSNSVPVLGIAATGNITPVAGSPFIAGAQPIAVAIAPNGKFIYVANMNSSTVSAFTIAANGTLSSVGAAAANTGSQPGTLAVDPSGKFLIVGNQTSLSLSIFSINASTGALSEVAAVSPMTVSFSPRAIVFSGTFVYVESATGIAGFRLDTATGALAAMAGSPFTPATILNNIAVSPNGRFLYALDGSSNQVLTFALDPNTGIPVAQAGAIASGADPVAMQFDPTGKFLYVANRSSNAITQLNANATTGALTAGITITDVAQPTALAYDSINNLLFVINSGNRVSVFTVTASTGALTPVTGSPFTVGTAPASMAVARP
ncbi:MAG TPA: beta-propeller fold lactonase family protein [Clostridia bacterium]|nr:beta-propeller fold lactonase family protein [Clostridia bacterium]